MLVPYPTSKSSISASIHVHKSLFRNGSNEGLKSNFKDIVENGKHAKECRRLFAFNDCIKSVQGRVQREGNLLLKGLVPYFALLQPQLGASLWQSWEIWSTWCPKASRWLWEASSLEIFDSVSHLHGTRQFVKQWQTLSCNMLRGLDALSEPAFWKTMQAWTTDSKGLSDSVGRHSQCLFNVKRFAGIASIKVDGSCDVKVGARMPILFYLYLSPFYIYNRVHQAYRRHPLCRYFNGRIWYLMWLLWGGMARIKEPHSCQWEAWICLLDESWKLPMLLQQVHHLQKFNHLPHSLQTPIHEGQHFRLETRRSQSISKHARNCEQLFL